MTTLDPYASFNDIMRWYREDICKKNKIRCTIVLVMRTLNYLSIGVILYMIIRRGQFYRTSSNEEKKEMKEDDPFLEATLFANDLGMHL